MTDMEKVVQELEEVIAEAVYPDRPRKFMMPLELAEDALALLKAQELITGETSDGYHTFNELYHHRAVLFSVIVANYKDRAWKSVRHHDGTMYDGMFIVGIDTPDGQATYHYDIDPYWDMFDCKVREFAPEWDGHTPAQAIERIGKLKAQEPHWISVEDGLPQEHDTIFSKLYGTDKWRNGMFVKVSDDVRVVKVFRDGTKRVHHDHTVDGRWESERKGLDVYGHVTHWMPNPELPFCHTLPERGTKKGGRMEMKPCPFCGSVAVMLKTFIVGENEWFYATCCACKAEINNPMPLAEEAAKRWNRRVNDG